MTRFLFAGAACCLVSACANLPIKVPDTAQLQPGELGVGINQDTSAVYLAQWAFADPGRTRDRPVDAARAAASMDYIAGVLYTSPHWSNIPVLTKEQLLQGRQEVRQALGVAPGATSQAVVDRLAAAADALQRQDQPRALQLLGPPVFTPPPEEVLARLSRLPYLQMANVSTMHAAQELYAPDGGEDWR